MADRDPEVIKQDIAVARERLASTVDSLAERANPQRVADDLKSAVLRFLKRPAVAATLAGVGMVTVVVVVRRIRNYARRRRNQPLNDSRGTGGFATLPTRQQVRTRTSPPSGPPIEPCSVTTPRSVRYLLQLTYVMSVGD